MIFILQFYQIRCRDICRISAFGVPFAKVLDSKIKTKSNEACTCIPYTRFIFLMNTDLKMIMRKQIAYRCTYMCVCGRNYYQHTHKVKSYQFISFPTTIKINIIKRKAYKLIQCSKISPLQPGIQQLVGNRYNTRFRC